jgi:uncharacterized membrane protein
MSGFKKKPNKYTKETQIAEMLEWLRLHFQKYIFTCLLTCMFQLMALNNKQNIVSMQVTLYRCGLCNNHDFDRPYKVE